MSASLLAFKQWLNGFVADDLDRIEQDGTKVRIYRNESPEEFLGEFELADPPPVVE